METWTEHICTEWHAAVVTQGVGVGIAVDPLAVHPVSWIESQLVMNAELRVLGMAVVDLLPAGRYLIGTAPDVWPLWPTDALPVYVEGLEAVQWHPALAELWELLRPE